MKDIQRYRLATILSWISLILLVLAMFLSPIVIVYDTFEGGESGLWLVLSILGLLTGSLRITQLYALATILALAAIYHCRGGGYLGQKRIPILPTVAILSGICFACLVHTMPQLAVNAVDTKVGWMGYSVWMLALAGVWGSSMLQRTIDYTEELDAAVTDGDGQRAFSIRKDKRSALERLFDGELTGSQRVYFVAFLLTLLIWPMVAFAAIFVFDAPIHNPFDEFARYGIVLTIWSYPILLPLLFKLGYKLSEKTQSIGYFYAMPWIPATLVVVFFLLGVSDLSQEKPDGYDPQTYDRIDNFYSKDKNHVYRNNRVIEGARPESFEVLDEGYAKDSIHVFYEYNLVPGADPATFVVPKRAIQQHICILLAHDDKDYYHRATPMHVADYESFKMVNDGWFIDRKQVYYEGSLTGERNHRRMPISDYDSFKVLNERYACDNECVYYADTIVAGADPATIRVIDSQRELAQDKYGVYYEGKATEVKDFAKLKSHSFKDTRGSFYTEGSSIYTYDLQKMPEGTDMASLRKVTEYRDWYADKNRVYYKNRIIKDVRPHQIEIFPSHYLSKDYASNNNKNNDYSHDGSHVWYQDSLMEGVDIATFKCGYDYVDSVAFAFDKNRYYEGHPTPLTEKLRTGRGAI